MGRERDEVMRFGIFRETCKYMHLTCNRELNEIFGTCQRPDRIPKGRSYGTCDEEHCPYYGRKMTFGEGVLLDSSGKVLAEIKGGSAVMVKEQEDPEDALEAALRMRESMQLIVESETEEQE